MRLSNLLPLPVVFCFGACMTDPADDDAASTAVDEATNATKHVMPTRQATPPAVSQNGILYHGGSVMTSAHNSIYYIWYGNWANNSAQTILTNLGQHIGGSPYFNINTTYTNRAGAPVVNKIHFGGSVNDNYSHGKSLDDNAIQDIVAAQISSGALPKNSNAVYFVLTSSDVTETSGFCSQYCGWHYFGAIDGLRIKYSFIGNPDQCPTACSAQQTSPNNNVGADGMASIISHELEEAVSDPYVSAWTDADGEENADKCAWTFGTEQNASNGSQFNVTLNGMNYLIQQNWVNANGGSCAMSL
jgi:Phosphate-induced protein 1 conserved region